MKTAHASLALALSIALSASAQAQTDIVANPVPCPGNEKCNVVSLQVFGPTGALIFSQQKAIPFMYSAVSLTIISDKGRVVVRSER